MKTQNLLVGLVFSTFACLQSLQAYADEDAYKLPLKLFGKDEIVGGISPCHLSFWQQNRDPETDDYAYLFHANQESDGFTGSGLVEIGDKFYSVNELVYGGEPIEGHGTQYLFASDDRDIKVQIELLDVTFRMTPFISTKPRSLSSRRANCLSRRMPKGSAAARKPHRNPT